MDFKKKLRDHSLITALLFGLLAVRQVVYTFSMLVGYPAGVLISYEGISQPLWVLAYGLITASVFMERKDGLTMAAFASPAVLSFLTLLLTDGDKSLTGFSLAINLVMCFVVAGTMYLPKCRGVAGKIWFLPAGLQAVYWAVAVFAYPAVTGIRVGSAVYLLQASALLFAGMWAMEFDAEKLLESIREKMPPKLRRETAPTLGGNENETDRHDRCGGYQSGTEQVRVEAGGTGNSGV